MPRGALGVAVARRDRGGFCLDDGIQAAEEGQKEGERFF